MTENDPFIRQVREQISDNDRAIVEAINARLKLVARLKGYKESRGMNFVDPDREEWMLQYLARANRGRSRARACGSCSRRSSRSASARSSAEASPRSLRPRPRRTRPG